MSGDLPPEIARFFDREARELDADSEESEFEDAEGKYSICLEYNLTNNSSCSSSVHR